jgi:hypothetical protein
MHIDLFLAIVFDLHNKKQPAQQKASCKQTQQQKLHDYEHLQKAQGNPEKQLGNDLKKSENIRKPSHRPKAF